MVYLNEQKVSSLSSAAVLADEYVLTHKVVFPSVSAEKPRSPPALQNNPLKISSSKREERECFYCHKPGHVIANCLTLKRKEQQQPSPSAPQPKGIGLNKNEPCINGDFSDSDIDVCFKPFIFDGLVSLTGEADDRRPVRILRDTGGSQSVILASALPFSECSACGYRAVLRASSFRRG